MAALQDLAERVKPTIYVDLDTGTDEDSATGTESQPYKSLGFAFIQHDPEDHIFKSRASVTGAISADGDPAERLAWKEPAKAAIKKAQGARSAHLKKLTKHQQAADKEEETKQARQKTFEDAKKIILKEPTTPFRKITTRDTDFELGEGEVKGTRVEIWGRIHRFRPQKQATFITLRDGYGKLQCILTGDLTKTFDALIFAQETSLVLYGEMMKVPAGQTAPDNRELHVDYYKVYGTAPLDADAITNRISAQQDPWESAMLDQRHLALRGDTASAVMKVRSSIKNALCNIYEEWAFTEVSPPAFVQTQVEGGSTLFKLDYYGEEAYLTQSSQLYLETVIPSLGNVFCIEKSFRAEKSLTRRHLSEYTHVEAELDFIKFDDLLDHLEKLIITLIQALQKKPAIWALIMELNPEFKMPATPFKVCYSLRWPS